MELILVRHGSPDWLDADGLLNALDTPLSALGHFQAECAAKALAPKPVDEIVVSPMRRARETAAPICAELRVRPVIAEWLEELRDPQWHGRTVDESAAADLELSRRPLEAQWAGIPGAESVRDFADRVRDGLREFLAERGAVRAHQDLPFWRLRNAERRYVLVAHAGTLSHALCHLLGITPTPWEWNRLPLAHASITVVRSAPVYSGHTFCLASLSCVEHIPSPKRTM